MLLLGLAIAACGDTDQAVDDPQTARSLDAQVAPAHAPLDPPGWLASALGQAVDLEGRDLVIQVEGAEVRVPYLSGELVPAGGGDFVDLESPESFEVRIDALEVVIAEQTIQSAMSGGEQPPFRELIVRTDGDSLALQGRSRPLGLPFSLRADPRVTSSGALTLELEQVRVVGVGVKGFLGAFQGAIENAANKRGHLIEVDKDHLVLNPFPFAGPPEIHAAFTSFEVREHEVVARLGELAPREEGQGEAGLVLSGGALRTGNTILFDTTLRLVANDEGDLVLDPDQLDAQIVGGVMKQAHDGSTTLYLAPPDRRRAP